MPKVSVIVPVYGVEKYIERCARSLFEQTLDDIEYLFIDDCTPDRSIEILQQVLEEYPQRNPQVTIHRMEKNSGQAAVRKWGMQNATGEYVIHCDSDDWVDTDMYRAMYEKAKEDEADVVVCDYFVHDGEKTIKVTSGCRTSEKRKFIHRLLLQVEPWSLWNKLFKRDVCLKGLYYPKGNMGEDLALTAQMALKCQIVRFIEKPYYYYFYNRDSITNTITVETALRKYNSVRENSEIVIKTYRDWKGFKTCLLYVKYNVVTLLFPVFHIKKYRTICFEDNPHLLKEVLLDFSFPVKHKIIFLAAYFGFYPHKIKNNV